MGRMLDSVTQDHVQRAAESLSNEFAGVFSQETIERYVAESVDLLGVDPKKRSTLENGYCR